jgi:hypothetical protein
MQNTAQGKNINKIRPLEQFKQFDYDDRDYWLDHYKIETTNSDVFKQIYSLHSLHREDINFYFSAEMRGMVSVIVQNHMATDRKKDYEMIFPI